MELKEKLVSSFIAFENQISLDNTFVHDMRTEAIKRFETEGFPAIWSPGNQGNPSCYFRIAY